jgi:CRP-like cAMP-binding protein
MQQLKSELDSSKARAIFETIYQESKFFKHFLPEEIKLFSELCKVLKVFRGNVVAKTGERLAWVGVLLLGKLGVYNGGMKVTMLSVGDLIGYMALMPGMRNHALDFVALESGYIAMMLLTDLQRLSATHPGIYYKVSYMLFMKTLDTVSIQYLGTPFLKGVSLVWSEYPSKRVEEYINKCPEIAGLIPEYFEKNELKIFVNVCKIMHIDVAKTLVGKKQSEAVLFVLVSGEMIETYVSPRYVREKEIIGFEQFFFNKPWECEVVTSTACDIIVIHRDIFTQLARKSPGSAIRIYKLLHRLFYNRLLMASRFSSQGYCIELDLRTIRIPPDSYLAMNKQYSPLDFLYNSHNLLPKTKESQMIFMSFKMQIQVEAKNTARKPEKGKPAKQQRISKELIKIEMDKTESGYVNFEEELEDIILYKTEIQKTKEKLLLDLEKTKEMNAVLKKKLEETIEMRKILGVK